MIHRCHKAFWTLAVIAVVGFAIVTSLVRIVFPVVADYRQDIEQWVHSAIDYPVNIGGLQTQWIGFSPVLHLHNVQLLSRENNQNLLSFDSVYVSLDLWASIKKGRIIPEKVTLLGLNLAVIKERDGRISVAGMYARDNHNDSFKKIIQKWFFSHDSLLIERANVSWENKQQGHQPVFFNNINLEMISNGARHQLIAKGTMPKKLGENFIFVLDAHGEINEVEVWDMKTYFSVEKINLQSEILDPVLLPSLDVVTGVADIHAWLNWQDGHLTEASMDVDVADLLLQTLPQHSFSLDKMKGRLEWQLNKKGWLLSARPLHLHIAGETPWALEFEVQALGQGTAFEIGVTHLPINTLAKLALLSKQVPEPLKSYLMAANLTGSLNESYIHFFADEQGKPFKLNTKLTDLSLLPVKKIPGFSGLNAEIRLADDILFLNLESSDAALNAPKLFRSSLALDEIRGQFNVFRDQEQNWVIKTSQLDIINQDISTRTRAKIILPGDERSPVADVHTSFQEGNVKNIERYYPVGILKPPLLNWLDKAIVSGKVTSGSFILKGPLSHFPFTKGEGVFDTRFILEEGVLNFSPGWPKLEDIAAEIKFIGRSMSVKADSARTLGSTLQNMNVEIKDFLAKDRAVTITGKAHGTGSNGVRYVLETPLNKNLGGFFSSLEIDKTIDLFLDIRVPLNHLEQRLSVNGGVEFSDNTLVYGGDSVDITHLHGLVGFSEDGIVAHNLRARVMGQPATINIASETDPVSQKAIIDVEAAGTTRLNILWKKLGFSNIDFVYGESDWSGTLRLLPAVDAETGVTAELNIHSMLDGVNIDLPSPLGKDAETRAELNLELLFSDEVNRSLTVRYNDILASELMLRSLPDLDKSLELVSGWVHLGEGAHPAVQKKGLSIYGQLPFLDFEKWQTVFNETGDKQNKAGLAIAEIEMRFSKVLIFEQQFTGVEVWARPKKKGWEVLFEGQEAAGRAFIPNLSTAPVNLDLNYYYLYSQENENASGESDPRKSRSFNFVSQALFYDNSLFGRVELEAVLTPSGLKMEQFSLISKKTQITGVGEWVVRGGKQRSSFDLSVNSTDVGVTLDMFGFPGTIERGKASNRFQVDWEGTPGDFSLSSFNGEINLLIEDGRLLEVEPGAGRIFGLLSLRALPRRLRFDFSDFFGRGFSFDTLSGSFTVTHGQAYTKNLVMQGPSAYILAQGLVDFNLRNYNQRVTVIPNVTAPLPLAIGIVVSPVAGLAAWMAETLIRKPLGRFAKVIYKVEGPWAEPKIKKVKWVELSD